MTPDSEEHPIGRLEVVHREAVPIVSLLGEIDHSNAPAMEDQVATLLEPEAPGLVLDLARTDYLDSAGVRLVFNLARVAEEGGRQLRIVLPAEARVRKVAVLTQVPLAAPICETVEEGVRSILGG